MPSFGDTVKAALRVTGSGYLVVPSAAPGVDPAAHATAWNSGAYSQISAGIADAIYIVGIKFTSTGAAVEAEIDIATGGAGSEVVVGTTASGFITGAGTTNPVYFPYPIAVAASTRLAVRGRSSTNGIVAATDVKLIYCKQADLVSI